MKHIIENWRQGLKFYSVWIFALIALLPDAYSAVVSLGLFEGVDAGSTERLIARGLAVVGIGSRFIKQAKPPCEPTPAELPKGDVATLMLDDNERIKTSDKGTK